MECSAISAVYLHVFDARGVKSMSVAHGEHSSALCLIYILYTRRSAVRGGQNGIPDCRICQCSSIEQLRCSD